MNVTVKTITGPTNFSIACAAMNIPLILSPEFPAFSIACAAMNRCRERGSKR